LQALPLLFVVSFLVVIGLGGLFWMRRRVVAGVPDGNLEWARDFSVAKYRPMQRLLNGDDYVFLRDQPGYTPALERGLRRERKRVFRVYLKSLRRDFNRLYCAAKQAVALNPDLGVDLCGALERYRLIYYYALCMVEVRLALHGLGVVQVDIRPLISALDGLTADVRALTPAIDYAA
jgi:hypothetical protein